MHSFPCPPSLTEINHKFKFLSLSADKLPIFAVSPKYLIQTLGYSNLVRW